VLEYRGTEKKFGPLNKKQEDVNGENFVIKR
jgi:hypothetical protein